MLHWISTRLFLTVFQTLLLTFTNSGETWDEIVFTQLWGYTSCLQFRDESHGQYHCRYEERPSIWSIHGIWPSKKGTEGPGYCTKVKFDESLIEPIEDELNEFWYEINAEKEGTNFWSHEWVKHGSCAIQLPAMDTEMKYFQMGLQLRSQYDLYSILKDGGIVPQTSPTGYHVNDIEAAIRKETKALPYIQCYESKEEGKHVFHLLAVEICLSRSFEPVDCSHKHHSESELQQNGDYNGATLPCPTDSMILYNDNAPTKQEL